MSWRSPPCGYRVGRGTIFTFDPGGPGQPLDRIRLVLLHADQDLTRIDAGRPAEGECSLDHPVGPFEHDAVVAGQIRFALAAVDEHRVDGFAAVFFIGGKTRAAHADQAGLPHPFDPFFLRFVNGQLGKQGSGGVAAVVFDHYRRHLITIGRQAGFDGQNGSGHSRMDRRGEIVPAASDDIPHQHPVAGGYGRLAFPAETLAHR